MGKRAAEPGSVLYSFQHGASRGRSTDLVVRNQNVDHIALLPETSTVARPRTMGSWTDLATSRMSPKMSLEVCYLTTPPEHWWNVTGPHLKYACTETDILLSLSLPEILRGQACWIRACVMRDRRPLHPECTKKSRQSRFPNNLCGIWGGRSGTGTVCPLSHYTNTLHSSIQSFIPLFLHSCIADALLSQKLTVIK